MDRGPPPWRGSSSHPSQRSAAPSRRPLLLRFVRGTRLVRAGQQHSLLVTALGSAFAFGEGSFGRLGLGDERRRLSPQLVRQRNPNTNTNPLATVGTTPSP